MVEAELEAVVEDDVFGVGAGVVEADAGGTGVEVPDVVVELGSFGASAAVNRLISALPLSIHSLFLDDLRLQLCQRALRMSKDILQRKSRLDPIASPNTIVHAVGSPEDFMRA